MKSWVLVQLERKRYKRLNILKVIKNNGVGDVSLETRNLVARLFWPYIHVKMEGIQKIIDHYGDSLPGKMMNGKVISLEEYKLAMSLE
jgi:hypothetical protein